MQMVKNIPASVADQRWPLVAVALVAAVGLGVAWNLTGSAAVEAVQPTTETTVMPNSSGDIADDSAIWINNVNPAQSLVIADNKSDSGGGLAIFDMAGQLVSYKADGKIGNVDLRRNFTLGGQSITIVGANNRTSNSLMFYKLDPATRTLVNINARTITTLSPNYGFCFYRSKISGKLYAQVSQYGGGDFEQWEVFEYAGRIDATKVRSFNVGSQSEGCVADDEMGHLYIGEEDIGIWKYGAEPTAGNTRTAVGTVGDGHLAADVEGLSIAYGQAGSGYLIASSQGDSTFAVYERGRNNTFLKSFTVAAHGAIDKTDETDGVDVTTANLGGAFTSGVLVVHDADNEGGTTSNLKYVPLFQIVGVPQTVTKAAVNNDGRLNALDPVPAILHLEHDGVTGDRLNRRFLDTSDSA
jgi:3-phytase